MFTFTIEEIAERYDVKYDTVYYRIKKEKLEPHHRKGRKTFYDEEQIAKLKLEDNSKTQIIYVTQTFLIIPSKMNFDERDDS